MHSFIHSFLHLHWQLLHSDLYQRSLPEITVEHLPVHTEEAVSQAMDAVPSRQQAVLSIHIRQCDKCWGMQSNTSPLPIHKLWEKLKCGKSITRNAQNALPEVRLRPFFYDLFIQFNYSV